MLVGAWLGYGLFAIVGGQAAGACEFPTAVWMNGCSGSLVHPEIVMYAAHCGQEAQVGFGEDRDALAFTVAVDHCEVAREDGEDPSDYAYCRLAEPVLDVPITPPLFGCELAELVHGREAWIAGWGQVPDMGTGRKHWAHTQIDALFDAWVHIGEPGIGVAVGDSGSGAYLQLSDGGWRAVGMASTGGQPGNYVRMDLVLGWVEASSGVDITPCTDSDGTWNPTADCGGFAADPLAGGAWATGCAAGGLSGPADTCGPAFGEPASALPEVEITTPTGVEVFDAASVEIEIAFAVDHPWPIRRAWVEIGPDALPDQQTPPFSYPEVVLPEGEYTLVAWAEDWTGAMASSAAVNVRVGPDAAPQGSSSTTDASTTGTGSTGDAPQGDDTATSINATGGGEGPEPPLPPQDNDAGCGCSTPSAPGHGTPMLGVVVAVWARRRRGRRQARATRPRAARRAEPRRARRPGAA